MSAAFHAEAANNGGNATAFNVTRFLPVCVYGHGGGATEFATETPAQTIYRQAGTIAKVSIRITVNTIATSATTWKSRKNGADGNLSISIGAGLTGVFSDTTNSDTVTAADLFAWQLVTPNTSGSITYANYWWTYDVSGTTVVRTGLRSFSHGTSPSPGYAPLVGSSATYAAEATANVKAPIAGVLSNAFTYIVTNANTATQTYTARVNNASSSVVLTVGAGLTGLFEDTANTASIAAGDLVDWLIIATTTGAMNPSQLGFDWTQAGAQILNSGQRTNAAYSPSTSYYMAATGGIFASTTESTAQQPIHVAGTISLMSVQVFTNGISASSTCVSRVNTANGAQTVTVGAGLTGLFQDTTNSDTLAADDLIDYGWTIGAGGTTLVATSHCMGFAATVTGNRRRRVLLGAAA